MTSEVETQENKLPFFNRLTDTLYLNREVVNALCEDLGLDAEAAARLHGVSGDDDSIGGGGGVLEEARRDYLYTVNSVQRHLGKSERKGYATRFLLLHVQGRKKRFVCSNLTFRHCICSHRSILEYKKS